VKNKKLIWRIFLNGTRVEFWEGKDGRWYWHKKSRGGDITQSGDYKLRRSLRRYLRQTFGAPDA